MDRSIYRQKLNEFSGNLQALPGTQLGNYIRVLALTSLNLRYEKIDFDHSLKTHPYVLLKDILEDQLVLLKNYQALLFAGNSAGESSTVNPQDIEDKHHELFNLLWNKKTTANFKLQIERFRHRIKINDLQDVIRGQRCLDLGSGNGSFCFALSEAGAIETVGIDFGEHSIAHAKSLKEEFYKNNNCLFHVANIYKLPFHDGEFDFVIQNGVFHHLKNEDDAIAEMARITRKGGHIWYYTDGEGSLRHELFELSIELLKDVPSPFMFKILKDMDLLQNKIHHLMDCMKATCNKTSWKEITRRLGDHGFKNFRRLNGGYEFDFDQAVIDADPFGREKFGEGILRVLAEKG